MHVASAPLSKSAGTVTKPAPERLLSLDVYRGLTIAGMILVDNPGSYHAVYTQLDHAAWFGATATDMVFPSFLFIVGVSLTLSIRARIGRGQSALQLLGGILRRTALLLLFGLAFNSFGGFDWHTLRLPGILQRIGLCYFAASLIYLALLRPSSLTPNRRRTSILAATTVLLLGVYWALLKLVPVPGVGAGHLDSYGALPAYLDRTILGTNHLWKYGTTPGMGVTYDPEGLLSTLSALATTLLGVLTGEWLQTRHSGTRKTMLLAAAGAVLLILGLALTPAMPLNKRIWTPTFTLFAGGVSLLLFSLCYWLVDLRRSRWWIPPVLVFGTNAILAFILNGLLETLCDRIHFHTAAGLRDAHQLVYEFFARFLAPYHASLAFAIANVLACLALVYPLYRKRIFLRL